MIDISIYLGWVILDQSNNYHWQSVNLSFKGVEQSVLTQFTLQHHPCQCWQQELRKEKNFVTILELLTKSSDGGCYVINETEHCKYNTTGYWFQFLKMCVYNYNVKYDIENMSLKFKEEGSELDRHLGDLFIYAQ